MLPAWSYATGPAEPKQKHPHSEYFSNFEKSIFEEIDKYDGDII